jgi:hypothetical protein
MPEKEKKHTNEELIGCTVLFKTSDDGRIGQATITSLSPSGDFAHAGEGNTWIDPKSIVEITHDPNAPPPEVEEPEEEEPVIIRGEPQEFRVEKGKKEEPAKATPKKK